MSKTIQLEATGETITFLEDTEATNGERLRMEVSLAPGAKGPGPHVHHRQTESFEVLSGILGVQTGRERRELRAGERFAVPAGSVHDWWNAGSETVRFEATVEPALNMEWMLREIFASCNRRRSADPSAWDGSYVITQLRGEYSLADAPEPVQRFLFPLVAWVGTLLGRVRVSAMPATRGKVSS